MAVVCGAIFLKINVNEAIDTADRATDRRVQVLEATVRVISERGAERTRLADVSRAAEVSIGLIQHYFGSRDDLLAAAFEFFNDLWMRGWEAAAAAEGDPIHRLCTLLRLSSFEFEGWREVQWRIWIEFWSLCDRDDGFRARYAGIYEKFRKPFLEAIREGVEQGYFSPRDGVEDVVDRLTAQIEGLRVRVLLEQDRMTRERMFRLLVASAEKELNCRVELGKAATAAL